MVRLGDTSDRFVVVEVAHTLRTSMPPSMTSDARVNPWEANAHPPLARGAARKQRVLEVWNVAAHRVQERQQVQCPMRFAGLDRGPSNDGESVPMDCPSYTLASEVALRLLRDKPPQMLGVLPEWAIQSDACPTRGRIRGRQKQKYPG